MRWVKAAAVGVAGLCAVPVSALVPDPVCVVNPASGRIQIPGGGDPDAQLIITPLAWPEGMVTFDWLDDTGVMRGVVQHCPTDQTLTYTVPFDRNDALLVRLHEMMVEDTRYGFDDLREEIRYYGGRARMSASPGRCACEMVGY